MKVALVFSYDPTQAGPTEEEFPQWLELPSLDEAVKWSQEIPTVNYGQVEIRRVVEM